jgi:hypothetical protein
MGVWGHQPPSHIFQRDFHGNIHFIRYDCPSCANTAHVRGACESSEIPVQKFSAFLCTGNRELSQTGRFSGGAEPLERQVPLISPETRIIFNRTMGVETPIPPEMINAAAPEGAPPRRIKTVGMNICCFSWPGCEPYQFMCVSAGQVFPIHRNLPGVPAR